MPTIREALAGAAVLNAMQSGNTFLATEAYRRHVDPAGSPVDLRIRLDRAGLGNGVFISGDNTIDFFALGITSTAEAVAVVAGYGDMHNGGGLQGANGAFYYNATQSFNLIFEVWRETGRRIVRLWGHSAGGGIVEVLARVCRGRGIPPVSVTTYGAPKPGYPGVCLEEVHFERARFMAWDDPVPLVPHGPLPRADLRRIALGYLIQNTEPWRCIHGSGGILLTRTAMRQATEAAGDDIHTQLARWTENGTDAVAAHSLANYVQLLSGAVGRERAEVPFPNDPTVLPRREVVVIDRNVEPNLVMELGGVAPPSEPGIGYVLPIDLPVPAATSRPVLVFVGERGLTTTAGRFFPTQTGVGRMAQSRLGKGFRFTRIKAGDKWLVFWMGEMVARFTRPSSATTFVRASNRWLRLMGNNGAVYSPNFVDAMTAFISAAAAGSPDYRPPLIVNPIGL